MDETAIGAFLGDEGVRRAVANGAVKIDIGYECITPDWADQFEVKPYCRISPINHTPPRFPWVTLAVVVGFVVFAINNSQLIERVIP